uniref:Snail family transcriptional repressor 3 n=1 Tax=Varanus komodoensis TaxID=61221 RepID=A0A8D2LEE6_VARKO
HTAGFLERTFSSELPQKCWWSNGWCPPWRGVALPLHAQEGVAGRAAPCEAAAGLWDPAPACPPPPAPQSSEAKGDPGAGEQGGSRPCGTPLRDSQNNLNLPSAPRRTPHPGSLAEGGGGRLLGEPGAAADPLERLACPDCGKPYRTFSGLARHRQQRCRLQAPAARRSFSCKHCPKEYASLGALKIHIRTHTLPCVCKTCGKAFSRPWLLQGHIRTHTGEKPYSCSHCSRAFADRSNLRAHLQTHSDIKKYQCGACLKTFSRMSLLLRHEESACCPAT